MTAQANQRFGKPRTGPTKEKEIGPKRRFVTLVVEAPHADATGYEVILKNGEAIGHVTSGGYGHWVGKSLAVGYVPSELARDGEAFLIDILGVECRAVIAGKALHDPQGGRLRA